MLVKSKSSEINKKAICKILNYANDHFTELITKNTEASWEPHEGQNIEDPNIGNLINEIMQNNNISGDSIEYKMVVGKEWAHTFNNWLANTNKETPTQREGCSNIVAEIGKDQILKIQKSLGDITSILLANGEQSDDLLINNSLNTF